MNVGVYLDDRFLRITGLRANKAAPNRAVANKRIRAATERLTLKPPPTRRVGVLAVGPQGGFLILRH